MPKGLFVCLLFLPNFVCKKATNPTNRSTKGSAGGEGPAPCAAACAKTPKWETDAPTSQQWGHSPQTPFFSSPPGSRGDAALLQKPFFPPKPSGGEAAAAPQGAGDAFLLGSAPALPTAIGPGFSFPLHKPAWSHVSNHCSPHFFPHQTRSGAEPRALRAQPAAGVPEMETFPPNRGHGDGEAVGSASSLSCTDQGDSEHLTATTLRRSHRGGR